MKKNMKKKLSYFLRACVLLPAAVALLPACGERMAQKSETRSPVDCVNPYMGNISHILVPTYPTVHLPYSMLRVYPERSDYTSDVMRGLPVMVTSHRGSSAFNISPVSGEAGELTPVVTYAYDQEEITPYSYSVFLDEPQVDVRYAPSHRSGVYEFTFEKADGPHLLILNTRNGGIGITEKGVTGYQHISGMKGGMMSVHVFFETEQAPLSAGILSNGRLVPEQTEAEGRNRAVVLDFGTAKTVRLRYGVSFIDERQAEANLRNEIDTYDSRKVARTGRDLWNATLGKIRVTGGTDSDRAVFYTSLYRTCERMIDISEGGRYYDAFAGGEVRQDGGTPFYTDDWIWDTYRAVHPLRILIEPERELDMIRSYIRMAQSSPEGWMPTFPEVTGDSHRMNGNHAVAVVWDAYVKGLRGFDLNEAYMACKRALTESTLIPWVRAEAGTLDAFYSEKGYFPSLKPGETETVKEVNTFEKRQPVAVTTGTSFDHWCLSQIARELGLEDDYRYFLHASYNYRNLYNEATGFFHPRDCDGNFIEPFDYRFSGGAGLRDYYDENNGWTYRWDVPHNPADLIRLMGSSEAFVHNLDATFREPMGAGKSEFYHRIPDQTGNVGQFSMANEPSMHIPYLYNYAGQPWMTQKRVRRLLETWFRNDLMGVPGDEDGGGLSAFVVFSAMGFYPVTPGMAVYNIGSPLFGSVTLDLGHGRQFVVEATGCSHENKYVQSATLNGVPWDKPWFSHDDIRDGGKLTLVMGNRPNRAWGSRAEDAPPSAERID
ncbi:MAG: GH92 family glycosyl hydrolase [Tannerella sp.]|jgi:predicted alpha-1,2-mannosidase|nr:GH92 family glycosyl hydrolase [Tannerella sp.]